MQINCIRIKQDGTVLLDLPNNDYKGKNRNIGFIDFDSRTFHAKRSKKHILRIDNSLGFNYELIKEFSQFDYVCVNLEGSELWTSRKAILNKKLMHKFSNGALELQIFYRLQDFKDNKADAVTELKEIEKSEMNKFRPDMQRVKNGLSRLLQPCQMNLF